MNKTRRKQIQTAIQQIETLVQNILDDEQEAYDNMPEGLFVTILSIRAKNATPGRSFSQGIATKTWTTKPPLFATTM